MRAELAAQKGVAPAPRAYVIWRSTSQPNAAERNGYELPGERERQDEAAFERWLAERHLEGPERLAVSVLVIREQVDEAGLIRDCVLERRRGGAEGPYYGNVARVEFARAAKHVRRFRASRNGRLVKLPTEDDTGVMPVPAGDEGEDFIGEDAAVHAWLGEGTVILDRRTATLLEDLAGLSGVIHARRRDGAEVACGVGWHGDTPFVLMADFPREERPLEASLGLHAAAIEAVESGDLIPLETRFDDQGFCVIARERGGPSLVTLRIDGKTARIAPYAPGPIASATEDQRRWMTYAETYEARTMLDSWRNGESDEIIVVTIDQDREAWRHIIDGDGIEVGRRSGNAAAAAVVYRASAVPAAQSGVAPETSKGDMTHHAWSVIEAPAESAPADSLLTKMLAWSRVTASLRAAGQVDIAGTGTEGTVPPAALECLVAMTEPLAVLDATVSAGSLDLLLVQARSGMIAPAGFSAALDAFTARLREELLLTRIITSPIARGLFDADSPFGLQVESHFPAAVYDIEEAVRCLGFRRATAAVLHAMKVTRHGIEGLERLLSMPKLSDFPWLRLIATVRAAAGHHEDLVEALVQLHHAWRGPDLTPADKYTEEEATAVLNALATFMRALAARFDATGEPSDN